jgi:DNA-binding NtrC family response regulator
VGGREAVKIDVRVVAATHRDLQAMVSEGKFREDLLYRLNVVPMRLPPLRERRADLPALVSHFVSRHSQRHRLEPLEPGPEAWAWMNTHGWPGNVRELENWVERAVILQRFEVPNGATPIPRAAEPAPVGAVKTMKEAVAEAERAAVLNALTAAKGNKAEAARMLGVSYKTLFNKLHEHGVQEKQSWS